MVEVKVYPIGTPGKPYSKRKKRRKNKPHKKKRSINKFYSTDAWIKLRYQALKLSDGKCELCGRTGKETRLNVDHIKPRGKHPELKLKLSNLQVLCWVCNKGKGWEDETDWRTDEMQEKFLEAMYKEKRA